MATRYWVGGSGTWDNSSTTHWSSTSGGAAGASVPISTDTVIFNTASSTTGSYTVTYTATTAGTATNLSGPSGGGGLAELTINLGANFSCTTSLTLSSSNYVTIDTTASNYGITVGTTLTIGNVGNIRLNGSTVTCGTTSISGTLFTDSSNLTITGSLTVTGTGALFSTAGASVIKVSGALTVSSGGVLYAGSTLSCTTTSISGTLNAGSCTFTGSGALTINSGGILNANSSTLSAGTSTTGTTFTIASGGTLNGGTANISTTGFFSVAGSIPTGTHSISCKRFTVTGTVSAGASITTTSDTFTISSGGSVSGVTALYPGSTFSVAGTLSAGTSITSTSGLSVSAGGTVNAGAASISVDYVSVSGNSTTPATFNAGSSSIATLTYFNILNYGVLNAGTSSIAVGTQVSAYSLATVSAGTSNITVKTNFFGGGKTFYNVTLSPSTAAGYFVTGNNTFNNLTVTGNTKTPISSYSSYGYFIAAGSTQTINGVLTVTSGTNITYRTYLGVESDDVSGTYATLTCAAVSLINADFYGVVMNGSAAPANGTNLGNIGNNTGITFSASKTVYWNLAGTQSWTATAWATSSGGTPALNNFPLPQDTAVFNNAGSADVVTYTGTTYAGTFDFSGRTTAMIFSNNTSSSRFYLSGNLLLGTTANINGSLYLINNISKTISGNNLNQNVSVSSYSNVTLLSDVSVYSYGQLYGAVSLNLNGNTLTSTNGGDTFLGNLTFNGGTFVATGDFTVDPTATTTAGTSTGIIRFTGGASSYFDAGNVTFNCTIEYAKTGGALLDMYNGGVFYNIVNSVYPAAIALSPNTYTFSNFNLRGADGALVTLTSGVTGTQYTLSKSSGTVTSNYLSLQDSVATGGAVWYAGGNSIDAGNNTGWVFGGNSGAMAVFLP